MAEAQNSERPLSTAFHTDFDIDTPRFVPLTEAEGEAIRGGKPGGGAGTCVGIGYGCWEKGTVRVGICVIVGGWL